MWGWILKAALAIGLDQWAKRKAIELAKKLKKKAEARAERVLEAVGEKAVGVAGTIIIREPADTLRPGSVVVRDSRSYRVVKLRMVNKLGAFYEAEAE